MPEGEFIASAGSSEEVTDKANTVLGSKKNSHETKPYIG